MVSMSSLERTLPFFAHRARRRHKRSRFFYFLRHIARMGVPRAVHQRVGAKLLERFAEPLPSELQTRLDHYYRYRGPFELGPEAGTLPLSGLRQRRNYWFDLAEPLRRMPAGLRLHYRFGDDTVPPERPTVVKARRIDEPEGTSVLLKLNEVRHFVFVNDRTPFARKRDSLVWRGGALNEVRRAVVKRWFDHPRFDIGRTDKDPDGAAYRKPFLSIDEQLSHKFVLSLEGNDVATNLKWILSSNSVCLMPRPTKETWFMEGLLEPGVHYVELRPDLEDLEEVVERLSNDEPTCARVIQNANAWTNQFRDPSTEEALALLVLQRYFRASGQLR